MSASSVTLDQWFGWAGQAAMIGWLILIFAPRSLPYGIGTGLLAVPRFIIPFGISLLYAGFAMTYFFSVEGGGFGSLDQVGVLLGKPEMLLAGWVHYLAFDLFIGGWIAVEADKIGLNRVVQAPILVATFMLGPLGLAIFLAIKASTLRWPKAKAIAPAGAFIKEPAQ
ncbi:MAG: ABA4-like family protein [Pseudomonadota bacterium]